MGKQLEIDFESVKTKICTKCGVEKNVEEFGKHKIAKDGLRGWCKECCKNSNNIYKSLNPEKVIESKKKYNESNKNKNKEYRELNKEKIELYKKNYSKLKKEKIKEYQKEYRELNKENSKKYSKEYYKNNPDKWIIKDVEAKKEYCKKQSKKYYLENKDYIKSKSNNYYYENKEKCNLKQKEYSKLNRDKINKSIKQKKETDPLFKFKTNLSKSIYGSFRRCKFIKKGRTNEIIGLTFEDFKLYLENKFEPWMTWENHGKYNGELNYGWDIDHIIPLASAKTVEDVIRLNHYTNLQPLCSKINRDIKRDK